MTSMLDELYVVFSRSPAYLLCKFKCVSRQIHFSREPNFCREQARNMLHHGDMHIFAFVNRPMPLGVDLYHLFDNGPSPGLPIPFMDLFSTYWRMLASWNGLVVLEFEMVEVKLPRLCICNPITGSWALIKSPLEEYNNAHQLVMHIVIIPSDTHGNDYKLIFIVSFDDRWGPPYVMKEYIPAANNWQVIENNISSGPRTMQIDQIVVVNDSLYIMSDNFADDPGVMDHYPLPYIVEYSLVDRKYTILPLPVEAAHDPFRGSYGVFRWGSTWRSKESVCLVRQIHLTFSFWTSTDGSPGSWDLIHRISIRDLGVSVENLDDPVEYDEDDIIRGFAVVNGDCFIFANWDKIYGYNINGAYPWKLKVLGANSRKTVARFISYSSTFQTVDLSQTTSFSDLLAAL